MLFGKKDVTADEKIYELNLKVDELKKSVAKYKSQVTEITESRIERKIYRSIASALASAKDTKELVENTSKVLADCFKASYCGFFELDHKVDMFRYIGGFGYRAGLIPGIPRIGSIMGQAIHLREPVSEPHIKDKTDAVQLNQEPAEYDVLCFPLEVNDDEFGVLRIANVRIEDSFIVKKILSEVVSLIAVTLERLIAHEKGKRTLKGLETGFNIARQLENTLKEEDILKSLMRHVPELFKAKYVVLAMGNKDSLKIAGRIGDTGYAGGSKDSEILYLRNLLAAHPSGSALISDVMFEKKWKLAGIRSVLSVPIKVNHKLWGFLTCFSPQDMRYGKTDANLLGLAAVQASLTLERASYFRKQEELASIDGLTGLFNHRMFQENLRSEMERSQRYKRALSLLMFDIDFFKKFNDTYGHPVGDEVLRMVSTTIKKLTRVSDKAFRYGGEEFCILLPETPAQNASIFAERLRKAIETNKSVQGLSVTISIGIAEYDKQEKPEMVLDRADKALYVSKEGGRNQVTISKG